MRLRFRHKRLRVRRLKIAFWAMIISLFFVPSISFEDEAGDNMFTLWVNGIEVGKLASLEDANQALLEARRSVNKQSDELTFAEALMTYQGEEATWGKIDSKKAVQANMEAVIKNSISSNLVKAYDVKINGYIVALKNKDDAVKMLQAAIDKYDESKSFKVSLDADTTRELPVLSPLINTNEEAKASLEAEESDKFYAGIDQEMYDLFSQVKPNKELDFEDYELGIISMGFGDKIEVAEVYLPADKITDVNVAIEEVTQEEAKNEIYKVVSGDTLSGIALKVNIPMDDIIAMNDSLEDQNSTIHPNDELIITVPKPKLSVMRVEEMYYEENFQADPEYILNDAWFTTDVVVHQQPSDGHRKVVAVVEFKNNDKGATEIIKQEITYQPVAKIIEKGTKIPPTYIKPIYGGHMTSNFGPRKRPTKGASTYHKGIDWAVPQGTPVYASCGGTVAKAGWGSGYGNVVYINHPDGRQTRYGHLSRILVSVGQSVSQGQKIALSGNTGVSTGPHLHFEILIGGTHVNPLKYI
ncbi:MAG: M23 family metallopeptidase [Lachnospiraceae bacterium]|nr:M23 family metallopeptidase [Lachnospiraceae bacterium]